MSWDIMVFAAADPPPPVEDLSEDGTGIPLGTCELVRDKFSSVVPHIDWSDPTWGHYFASGLSIEFNIGDTELCDNAMLHIRGSDENNSLEGILRGIAQSTGWYIMLGDEWLHQSSDPTKGFREFQAFRDKVLHKLQQDSKPFWKRLFGH